MAGLPVASSHGISRDCMNPWVALCRSLRSKNLVELRACSVAKMDELLTNPIFTTGLVLMKAALEDFFSWVDLLADWHEELHQSHLRHLGDLRTILTRADYMYARDRMRLESFSRDLVESEHLTQSCKDTSSSYASLCVVASRRHLQESIIHAM
ncbi:hypothetical protein LIER_37277 [Lithospermum erythrorhizon]|uniref:Uncharacterized protein n=1 Tax=Lithospermum erythrorhizon TaxID=34254 RepID=A0AAV3PM25_LITER